MPVPLPANSETLLVLSNMGLPLYSARGLKQTLTPIQQAGFLLRDINGELCDLSDANFAKYSSVVSGDDMQSPASNGIMPGMQLTVDCICELAYLTSGGTPTRTVVSGSSYTEGNFTRYRPQLVMRVMGLNIDTDEWNAVTNWSLALEEV